MRKKLIAAAVFLVISVGLMISVIVIESNKQAPGFTPPPFDPSAVSGVPEGTDESWTQISKEEMGLSAHVCGKVTVTDGKADLYFTNDNDNSVWMKLRIVNKSGDIIAETGLIKPGQYIKTVTFTSVPAVKEEICMKVMMYEPETYHSAGAFSLITEIS